jgi:hypothetical protein
MPGRRPRAADSIPGSAPRRSVCRPGTIAAWAIALGVFAACDRRAPIASCDDDLRGVYVTGNERWMILDNGPTLEAYPLFPDGSITDAVVIAPRVIDLERWSRPGDPRPGDPSHGDAPLGAGKPLAARMVRGALRQRFMRRAERCDATVPVEVTRCTGETIELVLADPSPPIGFAPCAWAQAGPSRIVRWQRE